MDWIYLVLAGCCEAIWAVAMKYAHGWTVSWPTVIVMIGMCASVFLLSLAIKGGIHLGTAYGVWTGIGTVGTTVAGILLWHDPATFLRLFFYSVYYDRDCRVESDRLALI